MTTSHPVSGFRRRALTALPLLLVPLLLTACSSAGGSTDPSSAAASGSTSSAASAGAGGTDLYKKYSTGEQLCALVPLADVSTAMQAQPAFTSAKPTTSPLECTYDDGSPSHIVSFAWSPAGSGLLDTYLEIAGTKKPVAIEVGGHQGRSLNGDVQVVVGDAAIDVFGTGSPDLKREAALAAVIAQKVG